MKRRRKFTRKSDKIAFIFVDIGNYPFCIYVYIVYVFRYMYITTARTSHFSINQLYKYCVYVMMALKMGFDLWVFLIVLIKEIMFELLFIRSLYTHTEQNTFQAVYLLYREFVLCFLNDFSLRAFFYFYLRIDTEKKI